MSLPTYEEFLAETQRVAEEFRARHGRDPNAADIRHNSIRRLKLGWSHEEIVNDINGIAVSVQEKPFAKERYDELISEAPAIEVQYTAKFGHPPSPWDLAHNDWRRLMEGYSHLLLMRDLGAEPADIDARHEEIMSRIEERHRQRLTMPGGPSPTTRPEPVIRGVGGSEYGIFVNPAIKRQEMADGYNALGLRHTRVNAMNAWAWRQHPAYPGTIDGLVPLIRPNLDERWDLDAWNERYFEELPIFIDEQNAAGVLPVFTLLELYSWNRHRKPTNVGQDTLPFHYNINGVEWHDSDEAERLEAHLPGTAALYTIARPDEWLSRFIKKFVQAASSRGGVYGIETANEMPEKPLHARIFDRCREAGFTGPIQTNRHEDEPSQYPNMMGDRPYDAIAFHGRARMDDLRQDNEENPDRPRTFIDMFEHNYDGPKYDFSKIVFSSDGCRRSGRPVETTYDWDDLAEVARYVMSYGCPYEHQMTTKMQWVYEGRIDVESMLRIDGPFLRRLKEWENA